MAAFKTAPASVRKNKNAAPVVPSAPSPPTSTEQRWRLTGAVVALCFAMFAFLYSVIQPPTALPDETANMQYVQFLATEHRFPVWEPSGHGEGGYETQHAPFAFALEAVPYATTNGVGENMRWLSVRFFLAAVGFAALLLTLPQIARRVFGPNENLERLAFSSTILLMPLVLMYLTHANPDGIALLSSCAAFALAAAIYGDASPSPRLPVAAGLVAACALLTKLSVGGLGLLLLAAQWFRPNQTPRERLTRTATIAGVWLLGGGWWYVRNRFMYGSFFIHTPGKMGTGLDLAARSGAAQTALFTGSETYFSTWAQRGWFPEAAALLLYALISLVVLAAVAGFVKSGLQNKTTKATADAAQTASDAAARRSRTQRFLLLLSVVFLFFVVVGQQIAFWTVDVEFNAGGRYMLVTFPAIALLLVSGVVRLGAQAARILLTAWIGLLLVMNVLSAQNITGVLNPRYYPGWQMFEFPKKPGG